MVLGKVLPPHTNFFFPKRTFLLENEKFPCSPSLLGKKFQKKKPILFLNLFFGFKMKNLIM